MGTKLMDHIIEIAKDRKLETVYGEVLRENYRAITLMKEMGFAVEPLGEDTVKVVLDLKEEEP